MLEPKHSRFNRFFDDVRHELQIPRTLFMKFKVKRGDQYAPVLSDVGMEQLFKIAQESQVKVCYFAFPKMIDLRFRSVD